MTHQHTNHSHTVSDGSAHQRTFYGLGIAPGILEILERIHFKVPTPIQYKAIPVAIQGQDVIGIAQTGTGKTHSFAIPMIQRLAQGAGKGLILAPTRELAIQIDEALMVLAKAFKMKTACLIGGVPMYGQLYALKQNPRILIATPGRFIDHIWGGNIDTSDVIMLVLDEADRMLDMGFAPQIEQIWQFLTCDRQTMLFSATMPKEILDIAARHMKLPISVEIAPSGTTAERVTQELFIVRREDKQKLLQRILQQYRGSVLLFTRTKHNAGQITRAINAMGHRAAEIHSDRSLSQRCSALDGFKSGKYRILVATDIAARGIDVTGIELVINYDVPQDADNYVHRIGRTARAGQKGHAILFATPDQKQDVGNIEQLIKASLPIARHPDVATMQFSDAEHGAHRYQRSSSSRPPYRGRRNGRS